MLTVKSLTKNLEIAVVLQMSFLRILPDDMNSIWNNVFKNGPSKISERQPLKKLK